MAATSLFKTLQLRYFSKPAHHRALYRMVKKVRPTAIVELGLADGQRAVNLIRLAQRFSPDLEISYTGIDLFEARESMQPGLSLKQAHQRLKATGANIRLVPGDRFAAMARTANCLVGTHLLVIGHDQDEQSLDRAWFYVPRILTQDSRVFVEQPPTGEKNSQSYEQISVAHVQSLAGQNVRRAA